jgi:outer membrane murein-binding lipoprotein Lpp
MKTMRWMVLSAAALAVLGFLLARAEVARKPDFDPEVRALRQQVEQLQAQVKTLEERLAKVESSKASPPAPRIEILPRSPGAPPAIVIPPQSPLPGRSGQQPKIWGQGEINGWPFYFIPCNGQQAR